MTEQKSANARSQYWKAQIDAWQGSGQSQQAFCKANELNDPRFGYWLRKFRERGEAAMATRRSTGFVPVIPTSLSEGLVVRLPNGIELRGITEQNLALVEQLLVRL